MTVYIIDYGVCNLGSVRRAFEECGGDVALCDNPAELHKASHIVLPGVAAFGDAMDALSSRGWVPVIKELATEKKYPFIGICLGMQLLAANGVEGGMHEGLGLIPGTVEKINPTEKNLRIPHVGWNEVHFSKDSAMLDNVSEGSDFYFVHSYHFKPDNDADILLTTPYGENLVAAVESENISGFQFHPEKSGRSGFQLIKNFLRA